MPQQVPTKQRLLNAGLIMLLERGYHGLGVQPLLDTANAPKGSFYHHFQDKEDFALQVIDEYMHQVHDGLDACLADSDRPPLDRVRNFFELTMQSYETDGYLGCLLGGLGQELSGTSPTFRSKIEECFDYIATRITQCLDEAMVEGDLAVGTDTRAMASILVDCWEGAALRSRLQGSAIPLKSMLDFYFNVASAGDSASVK